MMQFFLTIFLCIDFIQSLVLLDFEGKAEGWRWVEKYSIENVFKSLHIYWAYFVEGAGDKMVPVPQTRWSYSVEGELQELFEQIFTLWL